ncbi:hypothetical protein ABKN59_005977 [Abortiporus biennis]
MTSSKPLDEFIIRAKPPLDESFYSLDPVELAFFRQQTGIQDEKELKAHILKVQKEAYEVFPYPCIQRFGFTKLKISRFPAYEETLKLGRERPGALFLDMGTCFGNDVRKIVADGFPTQQTIASDLREEFWTLGHKLFRSTPGTFPVPFIKGDVFDPGFLAPSSIFFSPPTTRLPPLSALTTLTPLQGRLSAIHASSFFHLFNEEKQAELARKMATLLSPEPGSVIFGGHGGKPDKGIRLEVYRDLKVVQEIPMFCHSPSSWTELWQDVFGGKDKVRVWTSFEEFPFAGDKEGDARWYVLNWSVTRI